MLGGHAKCSNHIKLRSINPGGDCNFSWGVDPTYN